MKGFRIVQDLAHRLGTAGQLALVTLLGLPLVTPLLRWTQVPCTHDGHLHYHRIAALRYAWENGLYFSRWMPDVVFGYGYPFFNYREAIPLYVSLIPHLLGLPLPAAINLTYILGILAAGWFMYLWARDVFGSLAGLVSAVAYMAAPYLLIDALVRGNQPESMALALLPLIAWSGRRFVRHGRARSFVIASLGLALLATSHNISILVFTPFLLVYLAAVGWWGGLRWRTLLVRLALVFGLGLGLAAFYSGPAVLELDQITIRESVTRRGNDFHFNFATLGEIFAPPVAANPVLLNPPLPIRLGLVPAGLALLGLLAVIWTRKAERRGHIVFMALSAAAMLFMALDVSTILWEKAPLIEFVQFPWRFIGRAALPVAFLAGVPFSILVGRIGRRRPLLGPGLAGLAVLLLLLEATPNLYPHFCREPSRPTIDTVHQYEHNTGLLGVDPAGSYFPITVLSRPDGSALEADYEAGRVPQRFDAGALPPGATVESVAYGPLSASVTVSSPAPFQAHYLSYAFPGWQARVNGQEAAITPTDPEGLITFPVPAGDSDVEISWGLTPLRRAFGAVSLLSLAGIGVVAVVLARRGMGKQGSGEAEVQRGSGARTMVVILVVAVGFLLFKMLVVDRVETPLRRAALPVVDHPAALDGGELRLAGYDLSQAVVAAGDTFDIDLAWLVEAPPAADYQSNVWLTGPDGMTWSDKETQRPRLFEETGPTRSWLPGQWAWDSREVQVLEGTPPGQYDIVLTLFDLADLSPLTLTDGSGSVVGPTAVLGQIEVQAPTSPVTLSPQFDLKAEIGGLSLLGYSQDRQEAIPGEELLLTLFWQRPAGQDGLPSTVALALREEGGQVVQRWMLSPVRADYPPERWPAGQGQRGQHGLRLAGGLASGRYTFALEGVELGSLVVTAPERRFDEPAYQVPAGADFGGRAELVGYSLDRDPSDAQALGVTLVWRGLAEMTESYRVFVHLVDDAGQIIAQSDAEPAGWRRPTTGWAVGEYIVDQHVIQLPGDPLPDDLRLLIGLYEAQSRDRLVTGGGDFFPVPLVDPPGP
ncbi:MAG: glycosyltransferase family 39 protein [Chloroflexota bacterium]|jgi:hypothetical protein